VLAPTDAEYPALLRVLDPGPVLFVRGRIEAGDALAIAIVGSRHATPYGLGVAEELGSELARRGVTIVSGLARGIDTAAHRGALAVQGRTIAVLGSGLDVVYPPENARLAGEVAEAGAIVSQFPPGTPPTPWNFPARNRVIAGLSLGVVVVEAAERSGALITAGLAGELGREVYAVPGRITSAASRGANRLLQDGAKLVQHWTDITSELPSEWQRLVRNDGIETNGTNRSASPDDDGRLADLLRPDEPQHIEQLIERSGLPAARLAVVLLELELDGRARQLPGQRWVAAPGSAGAARGHGRAGAARRM
jgi:DNA processing protein